MINDHPHHLHLQWRETPFGGLLTQDHIFLDKGIIMAVMVIQMAMIDPLKNILFLFQDRVVPDHNREWIGIACMEMMIHKSNILWDGSVFLMVLIIH
jgi:hypothetical protein